MMMQRAEHNWNNVFINLLSIPWMSEISGAVRLTQPGLMAGGQAGRQTKSRKFKN